MTINRILYGPREPRLVLEQTEIAYAEDWTVRLPSSDEDGHALSFEIVEPCLTVVERMGRVVPVGHVSLDRVVIDLVDLGQVRGGGNLD
jgi:hypothetical protein